MNAPPARIAIVSNGHGEDVIGAALGRALEALIPSASFEAFPLVGIGSPYEAEGIARVGPLRTMPSGGFMLHARSYFLADLRAGYLGMTARQVLDLSRLRCDVLVVVGDVYAQGLAAMARARMRAVVQPLVSIHHHPDGRAPTPINRYFMERIRYPERALMRHLADVVYLRDEATAAWLRRRGLSEASSLGNPMVDGAIGTPLLGLPPGERVALLPGTRSHTPAALQTMAAALALLPAAHGLVAWSGGALPGLPAWSSDPSAAPVRGRIAALRHGDSRLWVLEGRFADVLASSTIAVGTAGTANEQAAARGLAVVSFPLEPHYTASYLANQGRLLGAALCVVEATPEAIAAEIARLLADPAARARAAQDGRMRMGGPGGSEAIARDILERWPPARGRLRRAHPTYDTLPKG